MVERIICNHRAMKTKILTPEGSYCLSADSLRMKLMTGKLGKLFLNVELTKLKYSLTKIFIQDYCYH